MDTRCYYDAFSTWYERERRRKYHLMIDDLEVDLLLRYVRGKKILEAGCGTGLLLERVAPHVREAYGIDLSLRMLSIAKARRLNVIQGTLTQMPFPDACFDVVYAMKVLAHIENIHTACAELTRITRPGGHLILEFYNPLSLRYLTKKLGPSSWISPSVRESEVYTRFDSWKAIQRYLSSQVKIKSLRGIRVVTPTAACLELPIVGSLLSRLEWRLANVPGLRRLGGFLIVVLVRS